MTFVTPRWSLAVAAVVALSLTACSDDEQSGSPVGPTATSASSTTAVPTTTTMAVVPMEWTLTRADLAGAGGGLGELAEPTRSGVFEAVASFLEATTSPSTAVAEAVAAAVGALTPDALERALGPDRAVVLVDMGPASSISTNYAAIALRGLAGPDAVVQLVVAEFALDVVATSEGELDMRVVRTGELTLIPVEGKWLISAYDMSVSPGAGSGP